MHWGKLVTMTELCAVLSIAIAAPLGARGGEGSNGQSPAKRDDPCADSDDPGVCCESPILQQS